MHLRLKNQPVHIRHQVELVGTGKRGGGGPIQQITIRLIWLKTDPFLEATIRNVTCYTFTSM